MSSGGSIVVAQTQPAAVPSMTPGPPPKGTVPKADKHPVVYLWANGAPGSPAKDEGEKYRLNGSPEAAADDILVISSVHRPSITLFLPPKKVATGAAMIVAPGGAFRELWITDEGYRVGEWLSQRGIAAFVLKYRLPSEQGSPYKIDHPLADIQRAIRLVRSRGSEWSVNPDRVGVMGFSAGGTLAGLAGTRFEDPITPADDIDRLSARPDFQALIYGTPFTQPMAYPATPTKKTPPTFMLAGADDPVSAKYPEVYRTLKDAGVQVELHIYAGTGHGFAIQGSTARAVASWPDRLWDWMFDQGLLTKQ
jgi:acetyl esterase/lipase